MVDEVGLEDLRRQARQRLPGLAALLSLERVTDRGAYIIQARLVSGDGARVYATGLGYADTVAMAGRAAEADALQRLLSYLPDEPPAACCGAPACCEAPAPCRQPAHVSRRAG